MVYQKFIDNISQSIESKFNSISTHYNFELGDEFEIALCELLSEILPNKYGICRGFVVTESGESAGDDIIIYAKDQFPTIRLLADNTFQRKQDIPIQAVYCYIEAKHTLFLLDENSPQSMNKAFQQVHDVKQLPREKRDIFSIDAYTVLSDQFTSDRENWPDHDNPIFTAIISRFIKEKVSSKTIHSNPIDVIDKCIIPVNSNYPDLVILGQNDLLFPAISSTETILYDSPFFISGKSTLIHKHTKNSALSIGIIMLLYALDTIKLGKMPYKNIIASQVK